MIVAIDPGKNVGIAYVNMTGELIKSEIVDLANLANYKFPKDVTIVMGNGTNSLKLLKIISDLKPIAVDEKNTSLIARDLYFKDHPAKGLMRLIPKGLRSPEGLIDDYAAYAIALRYLGKI